MGEFSPAEIKAEIERRYQAKLRRNRLAGVVRAAEEGREGKKVRPRTFARGGADARSEIKMMIKRMRKGVRLDQGGALLDRLIEKIDSMRKRDAKKPGGFVGRK